MHTPPNRDMALHAAASLTGSHPEPHACIAHEATRGTAAHAASARCPFTTHDRAPHAPGANTPRALLTVADVAAWLGVSRTSVYRLVERRVLPFHRLPGSLRFAEADVRAFLATTRVEPITNHHSL